MVTSLVSLRQTYMIEYLVNFIHFNSNNIICNNYIIIIIYIWHNGNCIAIGIRNNSQFQYNLSNFV